MGNGAIRRREDRGDALVAAGPSERRDGDVTLFDYTPGTVAPPPGPAEYGVVVSRAEIRNPAGGASCGVFFLVSRRDWEAAGGVSLSDAIERANRARADVVARIRCNPAWGMNAIHKWNGAFLGWQRQTA
ncbi:MAG: hypothetical protein A3J27_06940 [Candidatus Tectomicrobia bacterium RIFCSPLOWO2_12_FULL_69_37]|nr:MAG: hypothetical protein A3I72_05120 [Candidatus Tectomicrobia bacterium RIFCSPLOWO2_02_FULL_70_19]OGL69641.1 MAG: hypothetical protein A3J27_06940 [Candidatus Tectomicrobia bacterium RIFCSPLOWO2_12_FULL_69_37]